MDFEIAEELKMIQMTVRRFVEKEMVPLEKEIPEAEDIPQEVRDRLESKAKEIGLWALDVPQEYGGAGLSHLGMCLVLEEMSKTVLLPFRAPKVFGPSPSPILYDGNERQKEKYLLPVIRGEKKECFALTEPNAGSDPASMETTAVRDGDNYILNGTKTFITRGAEADFAQVFALTDRAKRARGGVSCFLVDKGTPGFKVGRRLELMIPERPCELVFEDCPVAAENRLGGEGEGFRLAQKWLGVGRMRHGPRAVGTAERALKLATDYAKQRVTFGKPLAERQGIQWMLADSATEIHAARLMVYHCACKADANLDFRVEASIVKLYADEMVGRVLDRAIQIFGGMGLSKELPLERAYRDVRSRRITEGASEIQRMFIARNLFQGWQYS